jgi:hypothetical protein
LDWQLGGLAVDPPEAALGAADDSTSQLVQAMASFGSDGAPDDSNSALVGADTPQQTFLTTPHA